MNGSNDGCGAVAAATDAVRRDPLREDGHRALARATSTPATSASHGPRYAQLTRRELGTEPSPDLWAMVGLSAWTHTRRSARPSAAGDRQHLVLGGRTGGVMAQVHR